MLGIYGESRCNDNFIISSELNIFRSKNIAIVIINTIGNTIEFTLESIPYS